MRRVVKARGGNAKFQGVDLKDITNYNVMIYHRMLFEANRFQQRQRVCETMCGDSLECKQLLAEAALGIEVKPEWLQPLLEPNWPEDGYAYVTGVLPDRDPLRGKKLGGTAFMVVNPAPSAAIEELNRTGGMQTNVAFDGSLKHRALGVSLDSDQHKPVEEVLASTTDLTFEEVTGRLRLDALTEKPFPAAPGSAADPKSPRPKVDAIPKNGAATYALEAPRACFGLAADEAYELRNFLSGYPDGQLRKALRGAEVKSVLSNWNQTRLPGKAEFVRALIVALGQKGVPDFLAATESRAVEARIEKVSQASAPKPKIRHIELFRRYCTECHSDLDEIATSSKLRKLLIKGMPPEDYPEPTPAERAQMLEDAPKR
jgi:hypothetical protein